MFYDRYINHEFTAYLNRYCSGIIRLKDKIEKISVFFELSESFSNHACRFYIDIDFFDNKTLSQEEKISADKFFYNSSNSTGYKFVSFIYKPQRSYHIDVDEIKSFIHHYEFAQSLFEGFIKDILPEKCILELVPLEAEPFFNYMRSFLSYSTDSREEVRLFEKKYFELTKREFDFDCYYHNFLLESAEKELPEKDNTITDTDLYNAGGGDISDIRRFIVDKKVPFSIAGYNKDVIKEIIIDATLLKEKIKNYSPESYTKIKPSIILELLKQQEERLKKQEAIFKKKCELIGIHIGDFICIENTYCESEEKDIGLVRGIELRYDENLEVKYNILKKDLSESRLPSKSSAETNISYTLDPKIFKEEISKRLIKEKRQALPLFRDMGRKNPMFKAKKKKT